MTELGLESEDYVAFLDESGEDGLQVVAGVLIPARSLRLAERRWHDFVDRRLGARRRKEELKGRELVAGQGVSYRVQQEMLTRGAPPISVRAAGRLLYRDALEHIAGINEARVLSIGLPTNYPLDVYRLWFWMACALLVERPSEPRPKLPMTVIDGEDASFRAAHDLVVHRFYRTFPRCQPYVSAGSSWFIGGSVHQDSCLHPFIQMADLVAGAARHSIAGREPQGGWYGRHLVGRAAHLGRQVDVSEYAYLRLAELSRQRPRSVNWPRPFFAWGGT